MKYVLFIVGILVFGFASAQKDGLYYFQEQQLKKKKGKQRFMLPEYQPTISVQDQKDPVYSLANGNKITSLKQDNMPCIIPDMSQFNMPCIKPEKQNYQMPVIRDKNNQQGNN